MERDHEVEEVDENEYFEDEQPEAPEIDPEPDPDAGEEVSGTFAARQEESRGHAIKALARYPYADRDALGHEIEKASPVNRIREVARLTHFAIEKHGATAEKQAFARAEKRVAERFGVPVGNTSSIAKKYSPEELSAMSPGERQAAMGNMARSTRRKF